MNGFLQLKEELVEAQNASQLLWLAILSDLFEIF
jgi:hypothetical protein